MDKDLIETLKSKSQLTRTDIARLLASIGKPGKNQEEKIAAVKALGKSNFQGIGTEEALRGYPEY